MNEILDILNKYIGKYTNGYTDGYFHDYDSYASKRIIKIEECQDDSDGKDYIAIHNASNINGIKRFHTELFEKEDWTIEELDAKLKIWTSEDEHE